MKNFLFFIFIFILSCSPNKVVNHHGVHYLDKKNDKLLVNSTNKNDIIKLLGNPTVKSTFDNDVWIYIERKTSTGSIFKLGKEKLLVNNVLVLEIDEMGLLSKKDFFDKEKMQNIIISQSSTGSVYKKRSFVYDFLSSVRQKVNNPARLKK